MSRRLEIDVMGDNDDVSFKRGELLRKLFVACWQRREKALLAAGKSALDAERESAKEAEAIVAEVFPDWRWRFKIIAS